MVTYSIITNFKIYQENLNFYKAKDEGSEHYLNKFLAPKNSGLKAGCPVMLVRN